jgi:predicted CoA-substrate-specific enzyme activase
MLACGIDVGSAQTKCVIVDGNRIVQGRGLVHTGANLTRASRHALKGALMEADCEEYDLTMVIGTGYGRYAIPFSHKSATETVCHAHGAIYRYPRTRTVLDMGGQDMTAIRVDAEGDVVDFAMNDKCSAGSGRFLESLADLLGMTISQLGQAGLSEGETLAVTNVCSVFAEQEVIDYLEQGKAEADLLSGVFMALARRGGSLLRRVGLEDEITITGGVSQVRGVVQGLEKILGRHVNSGIDGVYIGALGAALIGLEGLNNR